MNTSRLEEAVQRVREQSIAWDGARAARVLSNVTRRNEERLRRRRWAQRAFVLAGACTLFVVASLRAASTPSSRNGPASGSWGSPSPVSRSEQPALQGTSPLDDGGASALDGS
ncbi:hypothetical protein LZC95_01245 [Pendulispora brunnea]|uniref:Uncharacterized protein n=1 Tax=Pendulispora brunnea TaxID=2905690 RepID=A0ABZ2KEF5_9BACT